MGKKLTHEELAKDEVAETLEAALATFRRNRNRVLIAAAAALVLVIAAVAYGAYRERVNLETSRKLHAAGVIFEELQGMQSAEERTKRLDETIKSLQDLIDQYPDSESARRALYLQGNCYYYKDDFANAAASYKKYADAAATDEDRARAAIAVGYTAENNFYLESGNVNLLEEALTEYARAQQLAGKGTSLYYYARLNEARVLELRREDDKALAIYKEIMAERPAPKRGETPEAEDDPNARFDIQNSIRRMVNDRLAPLSFHATAKLRAEQLEAASGVIKPSAEAGS